MRRFLVGCTVLTIAVLVLAPAALAKHRHHHGHGHGKGPQATAKRVVHAVRSAKTAKARHRALVRVMRAVGVSVIRPNGRPVVRARSAAHTVQLYDFELDLLGQRLADHRTMTVDQLAAVLQAGGIHGADGALTGDQLAAALRGTLRVATKHAHRHDPPGAWVLRELGRAGGHDPARKLSASSKLDPLSAELVVVSVAQYVANVGGLGHARAAAAASLAPAPAARAAGLPSCEQLIASQDVADYVKKGGMDGVGGTIFGKATAPVLEAAKRSLLARAYRSGAGKVLKYLYKSSAGRIFRKTAAVVAKAAQYEDMVHGMLLALDIDVQSMDPQVVEAHYNHAAGEGHELVMRMRVFNYAHLPDELVRCGKLAGFEMPKYGGVPNVPVVWSVNGLQQYGTEICPEAGCKKTDKDGIATYRLALNTERIPGFGLQIQRTGQADAIARVQAAFGASFLDARFYDDWAVPKVAGFRWNVDFHQEPTLSLHVLSDINQQFNPPSTGSSHMMLDGAFPLTGAPTSLSGQGVVDWQTFEDHMSYEQPCLPDGTTSTISIDSVGVSTPWTVAVDALTMPAQDPGGPDPGINIRFHTVQRPSEAERLSTASTGGKCGGSDVVESHAWALELSYLYGAPGVEVEYGNGDAPNELVIGGWQRGAGAAQSGGGTGVVAFKDITYPVDDGTGRLRLELIATPAPPS
ncbi:MAG TPA: hypothetical protein VFT50_02865 [Baekduia sp.]|nr:hypothetical protein [Baekduia sp.]